MFRCAVSIASATRRPYAHRCLRTRSVESQSTAGAGAAGSPSGSATTCAAAYATRDRGGPAGRGQPRGGESW